MNTSTTTTPGVEDLDPDSRIQSTRLRLTEFRIDEREYFSQNKCVRCEQRLRKDKSDWCIRCIVDHLADHAVKEMNEKRLRSNSQIRQGGPFFYLVTFTRNPNSGKTVEEWKERVKKELSKKFILSVKCSIEHPDTNIHCHAIVESGVPKTVREFKVFARDYGHVDMRKIVVNNGVEEYIVKEQADKKYCKPCEIV